MIQSAKIKSRLKKIAPVNSLKIKEGGKKNRLLNNGYTGPTKSIDLVKYNAPTTAKYCATQPMREF